MVNSSYDVVIVGGGPAGMSAALWCDELGLDSVLFEAGATLGGQLNITHNRIENYLGINAANGKDMLKEFERHIAGKGLAIEVKTPVCEVRSSDSWLVLASGQVVEYKALILATGVQRRKLNIPGEDSFVGRGVLESGKKEFMSVKGKTVAIVGGGDAAFENTEILSQTAAEVILVHRRDQFSAREEFVRSALNNPKLRIITNTLVKRIIGGSKVETITVVDVKTDETFDLLVDAVLVRIGVEPNSSLISDQVECDPRGYVKIDAFGATNLTNIFAIGDVANPVSPTISTAAGDGATVVKYLQSKLS